MLELCRLVQNRQIKTKNIGTLLVIKIQDPQ